MVRERRLIIVVEDDRAIQEMTCEMLMEEGYQAIGCSTAREGFEVIQRERPELVIVDLWIEQRFSGFLLLQKMRQTSSIQDIPAIMFAANSWFLQENERELRALNCLPLEKPFKLEALLTKVRELMGPPTAQRTGS